MRPSRGRASLWRFAIAGALGEPAAARRAALAGRAAGATRRAFEEAALMLVLYAGFPAAIEALRALAEVWPGRPRRAREGGPAAWRRRGEVLARRVYGPVQARLVRAVRRLHPDLAAWMIETGYGRVLARPGLGARERALVTVAVLAATGRERQLVSHLKGAARLGAPEPAIRRALRAGTARGPWRSRALRAWRAAFGVALTSAAGRP